MRTNEDAHKPPRLTIELVPRGSWRCNLRAVLTQAQWNRVRRQAYRRAGYLCEICDGRGERHPVEAHEQWGYDEMHQVQRLAGVIALCPACHEVKHFGRACAKGRGEVAARHIEQVNGWTRPMTEAYVEACMEEWARRSRLLWTIDISYLSRYLARDELVALDRRLQELAGSHE